MNKTNETVADTAMSDSPEISVENTELIANLATKVVIADIRKKANRVVLKKEASEFDFDVFFDVSLEKLTPPKDSELTKADMLDAPKFVCKDGHIVDLEDLTTETYLRFVFKAQWLQRSNFRDGTLLAIANKGMTVVSREFVVLFNGQDFASEPIDIDGNLVDANYAKAKIVQLLTKRNRRNEYVRRDGQPIRNKNKKKR